MDPASDPQQRPPRVVERAVARWRSRPWLGRVAIAGAFVLPTLIAAAAILVGASAGDDTAEAEPSAADPISAASGSASAVSSGRGAAQRARLPRPSLEAWSEEHGQRLNALLPAKEQGYSYEALALYFRTDVFSGPAKKPSVLGTLRRGARLPVKKRVYGKGCKKSWYQVQGDGYVCTSRGVLVGEKPKMDLRYSLPDLSELLPYRYAKVARKDAERYFRIPTEEEEGLIAKARAGQRSWPDVVEKQMKGIYFLAIDHEEKRDKRAYYCTVRGRFVAKEDVEFRLTPPMYGEWLSGRRKLPLAIVYDKDRPLYQLHQGKLRRVGVAPKHARFWPRRTVKHRGRKLLRTEQGFLVERAHVRLARKADRPSDISSKEKWIHVDLSRQTLVAYEGDKPVFATVVSSGKEGYEPPIGLFTIHKKLITGTMNGADPIDGWYEVEEVPWTMYYWESFALHGTYWHNDFGKPRSHGCTNLAPADAKWLFYWTDPQLPYGWHRREKKGTKVYFTN